MHFEGRRHGGLVNNVVDVDSLIPDHRGLCGTDYRSRYLKLENFVGDSSTSGTAELSRARYLELWFATFCMRNGVSIKEGELLLNCIKNNENGEVFQGVARYSTILRNLKSNDDGGSGVYPNVNIFSFDR